MAKFRAGSRRPGVVLSFLAASALPAAADLRLEHQRSFEVLDPRGETVFEHESSDVVFLGEQAARYDTRAGSFIVRSEGGVFLWLDHEARTFAEARLPVKMEELLSDEEKECFESFSQVVKDANALVHRTEEERTIGVWKTTKFHIEGGLDGMMEFEDDRWITYDLEADLEPYHLLVSAKAALSPKTRTWTDQLLAEGGYPVESETVESTSRRRRIYRQRLLDAREVELDENRYRPPPGYERGSRFPLDVRCVSGETLPRGASTEP